MTAPTPPEVLREQAARAMQAVDDCVGSPVLPWDDEDTDRAAYLRLADAALAVFRGQQDPAVQRVLVECEHLDQLARDYDGTILNPSTAFRSSAALIRAAIEDDGRPAEESPHEHVWSDWAEGPSGSYRFCMDTLCSDGEIR